MKNKTYQKFEFLNCSFKAALNGRTPRLLYGILSLILGSMALLLPETKKFPLPRTIVQVETIPTSISKNFRRHRSAPAKRNTKSDSSRSDGANAFNDAASSVSGIRSVRFGPYDNQSTLHSVYELQEYGQDDTLHSTSGRYVRRMDLRNPTLFQPNNNDTYRQTPIAEDGEYDEDVDDDRTRYAQQQRRTEQQQRISEKQLPNVRSDNDVIIVPTTLNAKQPSNDSQSQLEMAAQIQAGDITNDRNGIVGPTLTNEELIEKAERNENLSQPLTQNIDETRTFPPDINDEENYFSEHC